ncbi:hypothetical protein, conserved, partial [Eimeria maxima]
PDDLAFALKEVQKGRLTTKALRLYVAALAQGDPDAKRYLAHNATEEETEARAREDLQELFKEQPK